MDTEGDSKQNNFRPSISSEEGNEMGFSFIIEEDDQGNYLDEKESDEEEDNSKKFQMEGSMNCKKVHPLAHLFEDTVIETSKPAMTKSNEKKTVVSKNSEKKSKLIPLSEKLYDGLTKKSKKTIQTLNQGKKNTDIDELLAKSEILNSDPADMFTIRPQLSKRKLKKLKKEESEKTKGDKWFGLPATEMTEEVKRELELLKMRSVLDPKRFYKKNDLQVLPKYFQIGNVIDSPRDFYNHRLTKKERKKSLVDALLADAEFNRYNKNKYAEILKETQKTHYKAWRQAKKLKKKK